MKLTTDPFVAWPRPDQVDTLWLDLNSDNWIITRCAASDKSTATGGYLQALLGSFSLKNWQILIFFVGIGQGFIIKKQGPKFNMSFAFLSYSCNLLVRGSFIWFAAQNYASCQYQTGIWQKTSSKNNKNPIILVIWAAKTNIPVHFFGRKLIILFLNARNWN